MFKIRPPRSKSSEGKIYLWEKYGASIIYLFKASNKFFQKKDEINIIDKV